MGWHFPWSRSYSSWCGRVRSGDAAQRRFHVSSRSCEQSRFQLSKGRFSECSRGDEMHAETERKHRSASMSGVRNCGTWSESHRIAAWSTRLQKPMGRKAGHTEPARVRAYFLRCGEVYMNGRGAKALFGRDGMKCSGSFDFAQDDRLWWWREEDASLRECPLIA